MAVEYDTSSSPEFFDHPDHHVGVNLHGSMLSLTSAPVHSLTLLLFLFCSLLLLLCRSAVLLLLLLLLLPPLSFPPPSMQQQRSLAVEFDTSSSPEFFDRPDHHVGVNLHGSMLSLTSAPVHSLTLLLFLFCSLLLLLCRSAVLLLLLLLLPPLSFPPPSMQQQRSLAVEFDTSSSPEFFDRPDHHVGVNLHGSMLSLASAPVHPLGIPALNAGQPLLATIRYNASSSQLTVWLSPVPRSSSRSASSFFAPPLPRSAVLTTFLDTCEWLGGNDPQAAAPPPPLFVGFTAATGKGAEQAQAHEVLGWSFEVGEAEDSLPFWAADSFSFPYITPATPLQTLIPLHTPRSHPPSAPTDTDPCKGSPVLPCGMGACTKARAPWDPSILVPSCKCPFNLPSFQPSHLAGLPSCFPDSFTCRQLSTNPCAPGVCIDDIDGTFSCLCPSPYFPFYFYPKGTARCYHLRLAATRMPTFLSPFGLTCALILNTYGLTQADFFSQNKGFQCRVPIPVDTLVNVTSRAFSQCTSMYTANYGDTCDSLNALFSTQVQPLNPALTCSDGPRPGQLLCVDFNQTWLEEGKTRISCKLQAQITPAVTQTAPTPSPSPQPPPPPPLANYTSLGVPVTVLQGPQSCQQLWQAFAIDSPTRFFQMNPGLSCDALLPYSPMRGNMMSKICVASVDSRPFSGNT
ncbi:unnamed protein product, partial [Closterium sp. NIES-65]